MKKIKITVMRITQYADLMAQYENPIEQMAIASPKHYRTYPQVSHNYPR